MAHVILSPPICLSNPTSDCHSMKHFQPPVTLAPRLKWLLTAWPLQHSFTHPSTRQYFTKVYSVLGSATDAKDTAVKKQEM